MARRANRNTYAFESVPGSDMEVRRLVKAGTIVPEFWRVESGHVDEVSDEDAQQTTFGAVGRAGVMEPTAATALQNDPDADPNARGAPAEGDQVETAQATPEVDSTTTGPEPATGTAQASSRGEQLSGDALDARAAELNIEGRSGMTADQKRRAIAEKEGSE